jgi:hypothetical protein
MKKNGKSKIRAFFKTPEYGESLTWDFGEFMFWYLTLAILFTLGTR